MGSITDNVGVVVGHSERAKLDIILEYDESVDDI